MGLLTGEAISSNILTISFKFEQINKSTRAKDKQMYICADIEICRLPRREASGCEFQHKQLLALRVRLFDLCILLDFS